MLLSVLIPTYNNASTIQKCVESALNQDYEDEFEVIVANNASTDNTAEILSTIKDKRLHIITNPSTVHLYDNHRICLESAQSDYVIYLHSDDELLPDALKLIAYHIKKRLYPKRYILWGHSLYGDVAEWMEGMHSMLTFNTMYSGVLAKRLMMMGAAPQPTGTCYSRASLLEIDGFVGGDMCQDWSVCIWAAYNCFEFEMSDRMWLKRISSGTWDKTNYKNQKQELLKFRKAVWDKIAGAGWADDFYAIYSAYDIAFWDAFYYHYGNKNEKLQVCKNQIHRNPCRMKLWVKYLYVMMCK